MVLIVFTIKSTKNMKREKTPLLTEKNAVKAMIEFLTKIKKRRGLTSFIQKHGVNGKWLLPDKPYDIRFSKLHKIMMIIARHRQTDEEFLEAWNELGVKLLERIKNEIGC